MGSGIRSSYTISLVDLGISRLIDVVFLHGYFQPTMAILYEAKQTWASYVPES